MPWFDFQLLLKIAHWVRHKWNPGILPLSPALPTPDSSWQLISSIISVFRGASHQDAGGAVTSVLKETGRTAFPARGCGYLCTHRDFSQKLLLTRLQLRSWTEGKASSLLHWARLVSLVKSVEVFKQVHLESTLISKIYWIPLSPGRSHHR